MRRHVAHPSADAETNAAAYASPHGAPTAAHTAPHAPADPAAYGDARDAHSAAHGRGMSAVLIWMLLQAETQQPFPNLLAELARQGVLGIIIVAFIMGWLYGKPTVDRLHKELEIKDKIIERQSAIIERLAERN